MIFKTAEKIIKDDKGRVTGTETVVQNRRQAKKTQAEADAYYQTQALKKEQSALLQVAKANKMLANGEINAAEAAQMRAAAVADCSDEVKKLGASDKTGISQLKQYTREQKAQITTNQKAAMSFKKLSSSAVAMFKNLGAEMAFMVALQLAIKGFQKLDEEFHITAASKIEAMETAVNDYNDALEQSGDNISTIKGLQDEFETLARGVNDAGENIGLSADEYERYHEIVDELVDINPELVQRYDKEGNAIIDRNTAIEKGIELQEEYQDKATRDYINSGDDILKGARVNINDALEDARKQAGEMGEVGDLAAQTFGQAFAATLKGEAEPGAAGDILLENISNAFNGEALLGGGPNFNDVVSDYLGREVDLAKSSISTLRQVDEEFDAIIANAKAEGYSDTALQKISDQYQSFHDSLVDIDTACQPIKDWLTAVVNEADEAGNTIASSIPEEMSAGFTAGLEQIAYEGGTVDQMKAKAEELAETLQAISRGETINGIDTEVSVKLEDGTKVVATYQKALEDAEKAKKEFDDSNRDSDAVDDYNEAVETEVKVLNALADEWESIDPLVAESLRSQANAINSYASENILTLAEAFNPLIDKFDEARGAKEKWDAAMEANPDYDAGVNSFKEVFDEVLDGDDNKGHGSKGFWQAAEQILGSKNIRELGGEFDAVNKKMKYFEKFADDSGAATVRFFEELLKYDDKIAAIGGKVWEDAEGIHYDIDADKWDEVADILGATEEYLMSILDMTRKWVNVDLSDTGQVKTAIEDMETTYKNANGQLYQLYSNVQSEAKAAGLDINKLDTKIEDLKSEDVYVLDLEIDTPENLNTVATYLANMSSELANINANGTIDINAEAVITQLTEMGATVGEITDTFDEWEKLDGYNIISPIDDIDADYVQEVADAYQQGLDAENDPFIKLSESADKFSDSIDRLVMALGYLPEDYNLETNFDEITDNINNLVSNENLSDNQKDNLTNAISAGIDNANTEIERYEQLLDSGNLTDAEKRELTLNIDNAKEQVEQFEEILEDLRDNGKLDNFIFDEETESFFKKANTGNEALDEELFKAEKWEQQGKISADNLQKIKDGTLESVFGNVNMDERVVIEWSDALKGKYAEELASWDYNPEIGTIDTVFGGSDAFKIDDQEVEVAYTPIMNVDGEAIFLGKETVTSYIQTIMDEASKDGQWDLSEILALDKQGLEIDGQLIQGLIAGVGDGAEEIGYLMHSAGEYGAIELAKGFESVDVSGKISNRTLNILDKALAVDREDIELAVNATVNGEQDIEGLLEDLDIAEEDRTTVINAVTSYAEGDMESYMDSLLSLPPYVQTLVTALTNGALGDISLVDGQLTLLGNKTVSPIINLLDNASGGIQNVITNMVATDGMVAKPTVNIAVTGLGLLNTAKNAIDSLKEKLGIGGSHLGTPQSPNYRAHSSFPSMAKGGRLGPRGNGGLTLTGELGTELVWIPSESRSFLVGQYGPEMVNLPGDAVVYPAEETRKIIGSTIHPSRLRFGTGSMAKGNMQFGSMASSTISTKTVNDHTSSNKNKKKVKSSVDTYEKELARLDHLLEMGYINEKEYYDKLKELYKDHKSALKKDVEANREALEKKRQARIDAYEHEKENLEYKLDRGKITEAKYYTELEKLGKRYFKKDGKVRKGYLDEYRQWLQDKRQAAEDAYKAQQDKLDHQLEMGDISEADYYTKLQKAYDKYKKDMSKEQKRQAKEDIKAAKFAAADAAIDDLKYKLEKGIITQKEYYDKLKEVHKKYATSDKDEKQDRRLEEKEAWIDSYEADVATLDSQLARGVISKKTYYEDLLALGKSYYTKDGKVRQRYLEEWRQWKEDCIDAQAAYVDDQKDLYNYQLERGEIDEEQLYNNVIALHNANPTSDPAEKRERRLEEDELWLNIYESKVDDLDDQLALGLITEEKYFNALTALGDTYLKDKDKFTDEYTDHLQEENDARQEAYEVAQEILDKQLEDGEISVEEYNKQSTALVGKWLTTDGLKDEAEDAGESIADNIMSGIEKEIDDIGSIIKAKDLGVFDSWENGESPIKLWDDMIDKLKEYYDLGLISEKEYHDLFTQCMDERKSQYEENQNQLDTVIDLIENALRQEANDYIDSLNKQVDAYNEIIDAKKESLSLTQKELDYQDDLNSSANEITKLQSEIALLKHDDSRAGQAKLAEKQAELAEKQRERDKMVRDETVSKTEENLNKQSELFTELIQKEIDKTNVFLNNQAAVLEMVGKIIETVPEDELREWLIAYNGEHGDGMISTVDKAMGDLSGLREKYGSDIGSIVETLQKGIDVNVTGGIIKVEDTDYDETVAEIDSKTHHAGLAAGFTGDGADLKQNEVWRKLTDDELVLNRADQLRLGQDMTILQSIKDAYSGMGASLAQSAGISSFPTTIEVSVSTPITIQGNATPEAVDRLEAMGDHIANTTLDKLANALQIKGISTSASSNMRKGN